MLLKDVFLVTLVKGIQSNKFFKLSNVYSLYGVKTEHVTMMHTYYTLLIHKVYAPDFRLSEEEFNNVYDECKKHIESLFFVQNEKTNTAEKGIIPNAYIDVIATKVAKEGIEPYLIKIAKFCIDFHIYLDMPSSYSELNRQKYWYEYLISHSYMQNIIKTIPVQFSIKEGCEDLYYSREHCLLDKDSDNIGMDLYASESIEIPPMECRLVGTGLIVRTPRPFTPSLYSRSSLFIKKKLLLANSRGVIDYNYCGKDDEVKMSLLNISNNPVNVERGEKLTQIVIEPVISDVKYYKYKLIKDINRGGFGHSGGYKAVF